MQFMLLIYQDEAILSDEQRQDCYVESTKLTHQLHAEGKFVSASPLQSVTTATTVRVREDRSLLTDGPFAETREQLGGFFIVEAKDLDEAIAIASRIPGARYGSVEVRPVVPLPGLPKAN